MHKSKNRHFYHIFVSPGDVSGAITLNVAWIEREFDAYKLPRCMCPSNYNRFWDRARYWWKQWSKSGIFHTPLHSTPSLGEFPSEYRHPLWYEKLEWCRYPMVKKFRRYVYSFWRNPRTWQTDGQTDTAWQQIDRAYASHSAVKTGFWHCIPIDDIFSQSFHCGRIHDIWKTAVVTQCLRKV